MNEPLHVYLYSGTHWDREWYQTFQGFRWRLVEVMNQMIDVLERDPAFEVFHLDGQTIVLDDYLEIEPEQRERLAKLIREGRVVIGPWYVMPDELLLSGESLIRNLATGYRESREWGVEPWKYGYICDIFGHIAQMPQIFTGFGIRNALMGRGTNEHTTESHFRWRSPDGSECLTFKLPDYFGYGAFYSDVMLPAAKGDLTEAQLDERLIAHIEFERGRSGVPVVILMDGLDHEPIHPDTPKFLERLKRLYPEAVIHHANLAEMGDQLESYKDRMQMKSGELYEPAKMKAPYLHLITHTLSSRYPLKQANDECQALLEKWVEPLLAVARLEGLRIQRSYVDLAYRYLMQNHPHDSICGCSIDQVHKDMGYRFDQTMEIGEQAVSRVMQFWRDGVSSVNATKEAGPCQTVLISNPLPFARKEVVSIDLDFPQQYPTTFQEPFGYELKNSFKIFDHQGNECPYGLVDIKRNWRVRSNNQHVETVTRHTVTFEAELPAMGKAPYSIVPFEEASRYLTYLSRSEGEAENEFIKLNIEGNGTISITDKANGIVYDRLLQYADDGEIGDGWYHAGPVRDRTVSDTGCECTVERVENGPVRAVFRIVKQLRVPREMVYDRNGIRRSDDTVTLTIESRIGLSKSAREVDFETTIVNTAKDHRLKLIIPTQISTPSYFVNQPFAFVERQAGIRTETAAWRECDVPEKQMGGIVGKRAQDGRGLAFVSRTGLHECAVDDDPAGTIRITLFRTFRQTVMTNGEEGGQLLGPLTFRYALHLMSPTTNYADLIRIQDAMQAGIRYVSVKTGANAELPALVSYFDLDSKHICVSVIKSPDRDQGDLIVRFINYSNEVAEGQLTCFRDIRSADKLDLDEQFIETMSSSIQGSSLRLHMAPWKIETYRLSFQSS